MLTNKHNTTLKIHGDNVIYTLQSYRHLKNLCTGDYTIFFFLALLVLFLAMKIELYPTQWISSEQTYIYSVLWSYETLVRNDILNTCGQYILINHMRVEGGEVIRVKCKMESIWNTNAWEEEISLDFSTPDTYICTYIDKKEIIMIIKESWRKKKNNRRLHQYQK